MKWGNIPARVGNLGQRPALAQKSGAQALSSLLSYQNFQACGPTRLLFWNLPKAILQFSFKSFLFWDEKYQKMIYICSRCSYALPALHAHF